MRTITLKSNAEGTPRTLTLVKDHTDVGEALGQFDFATAARFPAHAFRY